MQRQAPSIGRIAVMAGFALSCFGLLLFLWLSFGGAAPFKPKRYEIQVKVTEAARLAEQADVRIAGVRVGKVTKKRRDTDGNLTIATVALERRYAPINRDAHAILREKTVLGETYMELTRGTEGAGMLEDGGTLNRGNVGSPVQLDELLSSFDPVTRMAYRTWQRGLADSLDGRGQDLNDSLGNLPAFVESGGDLLEVLDTQRGALQALVRNTGVAMEALTLREGQLQNLVTSGERVFSAIDSQRESFAQVWQVFPTFLEESRLTYDRLQTFAVDTRPLAQELRPPADELGPTLRAVGDFGPDLRALFRDLDPLITAQLESLPKTREIIRGLPPVLRALGPWLSQVNPILDWVGINATTLTDMLANLGAATAATTPSGDPQSPGHYLRQFAPSGSESIAMYSERLPVNRGNAYINPMQLIQPEIGQKGIIPSFDCINAGGDKPATTGEGGTPPCVTQKPLDVSDFPAVNPGRFPRVGSADYSRGR